MQPLIEDCFKNLEKALIKSINDQNNEINVRQFMVNYTMDVIASCAFGTKIDTHNDPNNLFVRNASLIFTPSIRFGIYFLLNAWVPSLVKKFNLCFVSRDVIDYFKSAVTVFYINYPRINYLDLFLFV